MLWSSRGTLGPYQLEATIGAGGMGEVYRAIDGRLHRSVAIKILPADVVGNPSRRRRFEREARTISSLNHPHICTVYDVGEQDGSPYLVMEYLEGETLAARLQRGALPARDTIQIGVEIADALDHAHRQRIVHRDLKPANVMLTRTGAKLLDFGLARLADPETAPSGLTNVTRLETLTEEGTILGTVQYMAPEQLDARETDARTDIFAFGSVMYEMLTGRPAFTGTTKASVMAAILERDPPPLSRPRDASTTVDSTEISPVLETIVMRCLAKSPADRWQTAADLRAALRLAADGDARVPAPSSYRRSWTPTRIGLATAIGAVALGALVLGGKRLILDDQADPPDFRFVVNPPPNATFNESSAAMALSPDGAYLAFVASTTDGNMGIWVRSHDSLELRRLPGTDTGVQPFWSADSRSLAFVQMSTDSLRRIDLGTNLVRTLSQKAGQAGTWNSDGIVLFHASCLPNSSLSTVCRLPSTGGELEPATRPDDARGEIGHAWPQFLPDGRHFLYIARSRRPEFDGVIYAASLDDPAVVRIITADSNALYSPPGYLVFMQGTALLAQRFDPVALRVEGEPVLITDPVERNGRKGSFSLSATGVLTFRRPQQTELAWYDREGRRLATLGRAAHYRNPALSPDESRVAVERVSDDANTMDVWIIDPAGVASRFSTDHARVPLWSPDGASIAVITKGGIEIRPAANAGGRGRLAVSGVSAFSAPLAWTRDFIVFEDRSASGRADLWIEPVDGGARRPLVQTPFEDCQGRLSPDGRWLAYVSDESGRSEVYVRPFPSGEGRWMVSIAGGVEPAWTDRALLYLGVDRALMSVPYTADATFSAGTPVRLFQTRMSPLRNPGFTRNQYVVAKDGRILINQPPEGLPPPALEMIVNWPSLLKTRR